MCCCHYCTLRGGPELLVGSESGSLSCLMQRRGFDPPPGRFFSSRGDFSLGVNIGSDSIPQKLFRMRVQTEV